MSFKLALLRKDSYRRFPNDEEFKRELVNRDIYTLRTRNYLLGRLENHDRKERVAVDAYTIEHVMPQNPELSLAWRAELGEDWRRVQERLLHTLGNVTLTGYNSELSDRPFQEKRDMPGGFRDSPLRLNRSLAQCEHWDEAAIERRARMLADLAVQTWREPDVPAELRAQARRARPVRTHTLEDHEYLRGEMLELFQLLRRRLLNLDASVREEVRKHYIAYKATTNFVDVIPQKNRLRLTLNLRYDEIRDPKGLCRDITGISRWGNGDVEAGINSLAEIDDVMDLICQAFEKQVDEETGGTDEIAGTLELRASDGAASGGVIVEDVRRMLTRIEIPDGQLALYDALYDAEGRWLALPELAEAMGRDRGELPGLLGALGRRINETPNLGKDSAGNPRGLSAILDGEWSAGEHEWMYRMKPVLREALEVEGLV